MEHNWQFHCLCSDELQELYQKILTEVQELNLLIDEIPQSFHLLSLLEESETYVSVHIKSLE
jgi:hypothetical protein